MFSRVLVPYDGSEPAEQALAYGIACARAGAALDIVHVVDESSVTMQPATDVSGFDPLPLLDALEDSAKAVLEAARARCRAAGVEANIEVVHEQALGGRAGAAEHHHDQRIVMGTHGRSGLQSMLLGSMNDGVMREGSAPVLTVRTGMRPPREAFFRKVLLAVDDSDPSDAAIGLANRIATEWQTSIVVFSAYDPTSIYEAASDAAIDATELLNEERDGAAAVAERARAMLPAGRASVLVVEGEAAHAIVAAAKDESIEAIVMGSHGRRGLERLFLGSVAEHVVRESPCPVLVVHPPA